MSFAQFGSLASQAAAAYGIDPDVFARLIAQESGWNPQAVSPAGATGIAQFMPETAAGLGVDPSDPVSSLYGAARHIRSLLDRYDGDYRLALAAYNAGPGAVDAAGGVPEYAETQQYVTAILGDQGAGSSRSNAVVNQSNAQGAQGGIQSLLGVALQQLANSQLMGYLNYNLGEAGLTGSLNGNPTLPFMQYQTSVENADRAYQLDLSRYGLQVAEFNFSQRQAQAQNQLQTMGLLSGLRGPSNALAYDYALKGLSAPQGTEANPFAFLQGVNQPHNGQVAQAPARGVPGAALPNQPAKPAVPGLPGFNSQVPGQPGGAYNPAQDENPWTGWAGAGAEEQNALSHDDPGTPGYGVAESLYGAEQAAGGTPNDMGVGGNIVNDDPGTHSISPGGPSWEIPSYGRGGASLPFLAQGGAAAVVGDDPTPGRGPDNENEEIAIAPNGPLIVLSRHGKGPFKLDPAFLQGAKRAGRGGSFDDPEVLDQDDSTDDMDERVRQVYIEALREGKSDHPAFRDDAQLDPSQVHDVRGGMPFMERARKVAMHTADLARQNMPWLPQMAEGGITAPTAPGIVGGVQSPLSNQTYSPEQWGQAPFLQQLKTGGQTSGGLYNGNRSIGGTEVPVFNGLNLRNYRNLLPSQQGLYRSFVESPSFMGGLGINFEDNLAAAARHAFAGRGAGPAFMGR